MLITFTEKEKKKCRATLACPESQKEFGFVTSRLALQKGKQIMISKTGHFSSLLMLPPADVKKMERHQGES